ncbi:hypothetical protein B0H14DRAFT_2591519 [Mycena olivaceomarginata]|nr:hypothetical protein B0H14DRAFT_2591519 [Mycena olivaceomarginata]
MRQELAWFAPLFSLMPSHPICDILFKSNPENYKNDSEHDTNLRKHWYLVLGVGLFTKKTDVDNHADPHDILIFFNKKHVVRRWRRCYIWSHMANNHSDPRHSTDLDDGEDDTNTEVVASHVLPHAQSAAPSARGTSSVPCRTLAGPRAASATPGRVRVPPVMSSHSPEAAKCRHQASPSVVHDCPIKIKYEPSTPVQPRRDTSVVKCEASVKREHDVKWEREPSVKHKCGVSVKPETLPLYADMSDSELTDRLLQEDDTYDDMPCCSTALRVMRQKSMCPRCSTVSRVTRQMSTSSWTRRWDLGSQFQPPTLSHHEWEPLVPQGSVPLPLALAPSTWRLYPDPIQVFAEVRPGELLQVIRQDEVVEYCAGQSMRLGM